MTRGPRPSAPCRRSYRLSTHRPLNCLVFVLPLLAFFHWGTAHYGTALLAPRDIGRLLRFFGATWIYLPPLLIVFVLLAQHLLRRDPWQIQPKTLAGMAGESIAWMVPLVIISHVTGRLLAQNAVADHPQTQDLLQLLLLAVGAGVYEEFIFRLVLIGACMLLLIDVFGLRKDVSTIGVVIAAAAVFSLYHFAGRGSAGW